MQEQESIYFHQPSSESSVLNRVLSGEISTIHGQIRSNGAVWLANRAGIYLGPNSLIETASFGALAFDLFESNFLEKNQMEAGNIAILGKIVAPNGRVIIAAKNIDMKGEIDALSVQALSGGELYFLNDEQPELLFPLIGDSDLENPYSAAIRWDGITKVGKKIVIASEGSLNASGVLEGDAIQADLFGQTVWVEKTAVFNCPESRFRIGGSSQGSDRSVPHADYSWIQEGAQIDISGRAENSAGSLVLWGTKGVSFEGSIDGKSGPFGGYGGFVEISSHGGFSSRGNVDLKGEKGSGTLLWDPINVTISTGMTSNAVIGNPTTFSNVNSCVINVTDLATSLNSANVVINATTGGTAPSSSITFANAFSWTSANDLTLTADSIVVSPSTGITNSTDVGSLTITATTIDSTGANIEILGSLILNGTTSITAGAIYSARDHTVQGPIILADNTTFSTNPSVGNISFTGTIDGPFDFSVGSTLGAATFSSPIGGTTPVNTIEISADSITHLHSIGSTSTIYAHCTNDIAVQGTFTSTGGPITLSGFNLVLEGPITVDTSAGGQNVLLNGFMDGNYSVSVSCGTGDGWIASPVGQTTPIGSLTVASSHNFRTGPYIHSYGPVEIEASNLINLGGFIQTDRQNILLHNNVSVVGIEGLLSTNLPFGPIGTGDILVDGTMDAGIIVLSAAEGTITINGAIGSMTPATFINIFTLLNFTSINGITSTGSINMNVGSLTLSGSISCMTGFLQIGGPIQLIGTSAISIGPGSGDITISQPINGAQSLSLTSTGAISLTGTVGATTPLTGCTLSAGGNTTVSSGIACAGLISITGSLNQLNGSFIATGSGMTDDITITGPTVLAGNSTFSTSAGGRDISFTGSINTASGVTALPTLTLAAGAGVVSLQSIGTTTPIYSLTVSSSHTCNVSGNINTIGATTITTERANISGVISSSGI